MKSQYNKTSSDKQSKSPTSGMVGNIFATFKSYNKLREVMHILNGELRLNEAFLDSFFHTYYLIYRILNAKDATDMLRSVYYVMRNMYKETFFKFENFLMTELQTMVRFIFGFRAPEVFKYGGALPESDLNFTESLRTIVSSNIFGVVRNFILNLVSLRFFEKKYAAAFIRTLGVPERKPVLDCCIDIFENVEGMLKFVKRAWECGSLTKAMTVDNPLLEFNTSYNELVMKHPNIYVGAESNFSSKAQAEGRTSAYRFMHELRATIASGEKLHSIHNKSELLLKVNTLKVMLSESLHKISSRKRNMPIGFVLHGTPGVGKSSILVHLYKLLCVHRKLKYSKDIVYHRLIGSNFWDAFDPLTHLILHYPEVGSLHKEIASKKGDPTAEELLNVMDTAPFQAHQADVTKKGKYFINPEMVCIDTNNASMNMNHIVNNPSAIFRRFYYIEVTVKPQFKSDNSQALDPHKVAALKYDASGKKQFDDMDLFNFGLYKLEPETNTVVNKKFLIENATIYELSETIMELFKTHDEAQANLARAMDDSIDNYISKDNINVPEGNLAYVMTWWMWLYTLIYNFIFRTDKTEKKYKCYIAYYLARLRIYQKFRYYFSDDPVTNFFNSHWYGDCMLATNLVLLVCIFAKNTYTSESNVVDSSGEFDTIEKCVEYTDDVLNKSGVSFPRAAKKGDNSMDYDDPRSMFPRLSSQQQNYNSFEENVNRIKTNQRFFIMSYVSNINGKSMTSSGRLLGIKGDFAIMNAHYFNPNLTLKMMKISGSSKRLNYRVLALDNLNYKRIGNDLILIKLYCYQFKDISNFIHKDIVKFNNVETKIDKYFTKSILRHDNVTVTDFDGSQYTINDRYEYIWPEGATGKCGTPVIGKINNQTFLLAIHAAFFGGKTRAGVLVTPNILTEIDAFGDNELHKIYSEGNIRLKKFKDKEVKIVPVTNRNPLLYEDTSFLNVIGSIDGTTFVTPKSQLVANPLRKLTEPLLDLDICKNSRLKWDKPLMRSKRDRDGNYIHPYNNFVKKISVEKKFVPLDKVTNVTKYLTNYLMQELKKCGVEKLTPISLDVAVNGIPDNFFMRSMNFNTSAGYTFDGKKSKYSEIIEGSDKRKITYEVHEQVCEILKSYMNQESSMCLLGSQLKDEPRSRAKVDAGKTRVFTMSPFDMTLVQRMYLMPFYSLMVEHSEVFKSAIGINMHSIEAHELYHKMKGFSPVIMSGDYGGYDTSMPISLGLAANSVLFNVLKGMGYNEVALNIVEGILNDNLFPIIVLDGNLVQVPGFQPSGKYATAEDNSLRNLILILIAFFDLCPEDEIDCSRPFDYIMPITYGDDVVISIKADVSFYFNNITYAKYCKENYGMNFTTCGKLEHTMPFHPVDTMSFLKRNFKHSRILNRTVAVLEKESLLKTCTWLLPSKDISINNQAYEALISVLTELFFHCDTEEEYNNLYKIASNFVIKDLDDDIKKLPTLDVLMERYQVDKSN